MNSKKQQRIIEANEQCRRLFGPAVEVLSKAYCDPARPKLTHYWLAEKLNISHYVAFRLLARVAWKKHFCIQIPTTGQIFWKDAKIPAGEVFDALVHNQRIRSC